MASKQNVGQVGQCWNFCGPYPPTPIIPGLNCWLLLWNILWILFYWLVGVYKLQGLDCAKSTSKWKINYDLKINAGHLVCVHGCMCVWEREFICNEAGVHMWSCNCWIFVMHIHTHTHTHMYIYIYIYIKIIYLTLHKNIFPNPLHIYFFQTTAH